MSFKRTEAPFVLLIIILWGILVVGVDWVRPLYFSNEEMHYASIAWEMWQSNHYILPVQGGIPYAEKGPLLFWLIHLGWSVMGVSTVWLRLMPALFGLWTVFLVQKLSLLFWPEEQEKAKMAALILLGSFFFAAKIPVVRFDVITTFFVLFCIYQMVKAIEHNPRHWILFSFSLSLGILAKGPVMFLFVLPPALTMVYWAQPANSFKNNYLKLIISILASLLLVCCWLIPALMEGGANYAYQLLFSRSVGRIWTIKSYLHQNWLYYVFILGMMLLPWILSFTFWKSFAESIQRIKKDGLDKKILLLLIIMGSSFIIFTLVAQKAPRYIMPLLPFFALLIAQVMMSSSQVKTYHQSLIALGYIILGILYALIPYIGPLKFHQKYPWLVDISPFWGCCWIALGLFWLLWRRMNREILVIGLTVSTVLFWTCFNLGLTRAQAPYGDWRNLSQQVSSLQKSGSPVAFMGTYQEIEFFGRLTKPLVSLPTKEDQENWLHQNPDGWLVIQDYGISPMQLRLVSAKEVEFPNE